MMLTINAPPKMPAPIPMPILAARESEFSEWGIVLGTEVGLKLELVVARPDVAAGKERTLEKSLRVAMWDVPLLIEMISPYISTGGRAKADFASLQSQAASAVSQQQNRELVSLPPQ
jgi:hypothetical protein